MTSVMPDFTESCLAILLRPAPAERPFSSLLLCLSPTLFHFLSSTWHQPQTGKTMDGLPKNQFIIKKQFHLRAVLPGSIKMRTQPSRHSSLQLTAPLWGNELGKGLHILRRGSRKNTWVGGCCCVVLVESSKHL